MLKRLVCGVLSLLLVLLCGIASAEQELFLFMDVPFSLSFFEAQRAYEDKGIPVTYDSANKKSQLSMFGYDISEVKVINGYDKDDNWTFGSVRITFKEIKSSISERFHKYADALIMFNDIYQKCVDKFGTPDGIHYSFYSVEEGNIAPEMFSVKDVFSREHFGGVDSGGVTIYFNNVSLFLSMNLSKLGTEANAYLHYYAEPIEINTESFDIDLSPSVTPEPQVINLG